MILINFWLLAAVLFFFGVLLYATGWGLGIQSGDFKGYRRGYKDGYDTGYQSGHDAKISRYK